MGIKYIKILISCQNINSIEHHLNILIFEKQKPEKPTLGGYFASRDNQYITNIYALY